MQRLSRAAAKRSLSKQQFVEIAVLREIAVFEEATSRNQLVLGKDKIIGVDSEDDRPHKKEKSTGRLGIADRLRQQDQRAAPAVPEFPTPAPVVVNVGGQAGSSGGDIINALAQHVVSGNDFERSTRLRHAVEILKTVTSTEEERKVLAARLDEAIAAKTDTTTPTNGDSPVVRTARIAFDKLAGLLNK